MELMEIIENSELEPESMTVEELFHIVLHELGFSFKIRGTKYLEDLFSIVYERFENTCDVRTTALYPEIAVMNNTTAAAVSRGVLYAITVAWDKGNPRLQNELFASTIDPEKGKPTVHEFICLMMEFLKL